MRTILEDADGPTEMPFILREEDGEFRINFEATLAGLMGDSPDRILEQLVEFMAAEKDEEEPETPEV